MKVIIEQRAGADYPASYKWNKEFRQSQVRTIRDRLQLRSIDVVEIREV